MAYVPGKSFWIGADDTGTETVSDAYWIGETEVTYELWSTVYEWATDMERRVNVYAFANAGRLGSSGSGSG